MRLLYIVYVLIALGILSELSLSSNLDDTRLLYTLHTEEGDIRCNYHNSRDIRSGRMVYYDHKTKERQYIQYSKIDSITIHNDYWLTSGPKDRKMKYIHSNNKH